MACFSGKNKYSGLYQLHSFIELRLTGWHSVTKRLRGSIVCGFDPLTKFLTHTGLPTPNDYLSLADIIRNLYRDLVNSICCRAFIAYVVAILCIAKKCKNND